MNNNKKLGIFIVIVGFLIIVAISIYLFRRNSATVVEPTLIDDVPAEQLPVVSETRNTTPEDRPLRQEYDVSQEAEHEVNGNDVAKLAVAFAERLGSYSNQSNYSNFEDLNIFMTSSMRDWAKTYVEKTRRDNPYGGSYYGVVTKAVSTEIVSFSDDQGRAEVIIGTQRGETLSDGGENSYQQNLRLTFVKESHQWLVDGAYWLK
jgi:hypothetical protein